MRRSTLHDLICVWAAATTAASGCRSAPTVITKAPPPPPAATAIPPAALASSDRPTIAIDAAATGGALDLALPGPREQRAAAIVAVPLDATATAQLVARLEPLPDLTAANAKAPTLRPSSLPPPRAGGNQPIAFVVPAGKPVGDAPFGGAPVKPAPRPLTPPQITPIDEVAAESVVRIRFADAMVPVAQVGEVTAPPATLTPAVPGTWRWIDSRVLTFTAAGARLPQATTFTVTVAAGVRSLEGGALAQPVTGTFSTPPIALAGVYPALLRSDAAIAVRLDQPFDAARLAAKLTFKPVRGAAKGTPVAWKVVDLATAEASWRKDPSIKFDAARREALLGKHHLFVAPVTAWPTGVEIQAQLAPKAASSEGPRLSTRASFALFDVAPEFRVRGFACGWEEAKARMTGARCPANDYAQVVFSNPIEPASYRANKLQIDGEPFGDNAPSGNLVSLWTPPQAYRTFTISVAADLVDIHGQPLRGPRQPTFTTTPQVWSPYVYADSGLIILDPRFTIPQWVVTGQAVDELHVRLYQVTPADYFAYQRYERGELKTPPGKRIVDQRYPVGRKSGAVLRVDLRPALTAAGTGHVIAEVTTGAARTADVRARAWIQVTRLGVAARLDREQVSTWVQDISTDHFLAPVPDAKLAVLVDGRTRTPDTTTTDASGHGALALVAAQPRTKARPYPSALLTVTTAQDSTFTAINPFEKSVRTNLARWYVTDDRFTYKPGETVYLKGWVRWSHDGVNPDIALPGAGESVAYTLQDPRGNKLASGTAPLTADGGFDLEVALPPNVNLGTSTFTLTTRTASLRHPISVQEFRTPAYAVNLNDDVTHSGAVPLILGEKIEMTTEAKYYAGGGLGGASLAWNAELEATRYSPPNWSLFRFTPPRPRTELDDYYYDRGVENGRVETARDTQLSSASTSTAVFGIAALPSGRPSILTVDATVADLDRQRIRASSRPILVHPSAYYVGLRPRPESREAVDVIVTTIDGEPVVGVPIAVEIEGVLGSERFRDDAVVIDTDRCTLTSAATPVTCQFTRKDAQTAYLAVARVADARGRTNAAQYMLPWWATRDPRKDLALVADRPSYSPGDVAKVEIVSKLVPATAVVSFARQGVISQRRVELTQESTIVDLPIEPGFIQNVHVVIDRFAKRPRPRTNDPGALPDHTTTELELPVEVESARLAVTARAVTPLIEPGAQATFEVEVRRGGAAVTNAEVALIVVDEAVLALSTKTHGDPLPVFYKKVGAGTTRLGTLNQVQDAGGQLTGVPGFETYKLGEGRGSGTGSGSGYGSGSGSLGGRSVMSPSVTVGVVKARKDFRANAVFAPQLHTDANGKARISVKMPDSLTRFRIVALATATNRYFGKGENTIITQRKLNARTTAPRFLTQGDAFSLPILVQNLDTQPREISVAVRAANLVGTGPMGKRVTVPGGQRAEVRFDFTTAARGKAVIQTIVQSGAFADASNVELPVWEPATTESFATYGVVDSAPQFEQLVVPPSIFPDVGGVEVEVASTQLQNLTDAYWYLYAYPYECAEQRSSRMLATSSLYDILDAFAVPGRPSRIEIDAQRVTDLDKLAKTQQPDGGWGYFRGMRSDPFVTMQVLMALAADGAKGAVLAGAIRYVNNQALEQAARIARAVAKPAAQRTERTELPYVISLAATSLTALAAAGVDIEARAHTLHAQATALAIYPVEAKARVLALLANNPRAREARTRLVADLLSATQETASSATVTTSYVEAERLLLVSNLKTSALALDALMREAPEHPLITKLARGVLDARKYGRWSSTQDNLVALRALRRYFDTYEKATPNFTGKLWFGKAAYAEQAFVGRSNARGQARLDWTALPPGSTHDLSLVKDGPGRLYYRVGITYAPRQTSLPALDAGFLVRRSYTAIDDPADVTKLPDGRIRVRLGARVLVSIETLTTTLRHAVAVVDPLPAGFEAVNASLAIAERPAAVSADTYWDYENLRDNRSEAFAMQLTEGVHRFSYTARANTPGTFLAAPAKAEEMYSPETFGRSTGVTVVIE